MSKRVATGVVDAAYNPCPHGPILAKVCSVRPKVGVTCMHGAPGSHEEASCEVDVLKIDAEGHDFEVLRGAGSSDSLHFGEPVNQGCLQVCMLGPSWTSND